MKNTLKKFLAITLLSAVAIIQLPAQTNPPTAGMLSTKDSAEIEKAKVEADKELARQKLDVEKTETLNAQDAAKSEALNAQDAAKAEVLNVQDAKKMMVHDLVWNSWVLAVLGYILLSGLFRHQRNKLVQQTVRLMIEKGSPVTPELVTALKSRNRSGSRIDPHGHLAWGLILAAVGIGVMMVAGKAGWIVLLIGGAFLLLWIVDRCSSNNGQPK
jgi:hypothetical protein